jgi:hypothetical protein
MMIVGNAFRALFYAFMALQCDIQKVKNSMTLAR